MSSSVGPFEWTTAQMAIEPHEYHRFTGSADLHLGEGERLGERQGRRSGISLTDSEHRVGLLPDRDLPRFLFLSVRSRKVGISRANRNPNTIPHLTGEACAYIGSHFLRWMSSEPS